MAKNIFNSRHINIQPFRDNGLFTELIELNQSQYSNEELLEIIEGMTGQEVDELIGACLAHRAKKREKNDGKIDYED